MANHCIDCKKGIGEKPIRCWDCHILYRKTDKYRQNHSKQIRAARNRGRWRCVDCGEGIYSGATRCWACYVSHIQIYGGPRKGQPVTQETRDKIGKANKGHVPWNKGLKMGPLSKELKAKYSKTQKEYWAGLSPERKKELSQINSRSKMGRIFTDESRKKMSGARSRWCKIHGPSRGMQGKHHTDETKQKMRESRLKYLAEMSPRGFWEPTKPEKDIQNILDKLGIEYKFNDFRLETRTYDFYLPEYNVLVEYDGYYWHSLPGVSERDSYKDGLAKKAGLRLIRLKGLPNRDLIYAEIHEQLLGSLG